MTDTTAGDARPAPVPAVGAKVGLGLYIGFGAMALGQFMAMLDIQIVASSLQQIQAGVSASADEISWIQTAYIIPEVVMIPLSAYLSRMWGTRLVFMLSCAGFVLASILTGLSTSIEMMILTRAIQGFVGGAMIPTVMAVAFTAFPPEKRVTASMLIGMIVTLAPTIGPTLGGWITENLDWRWLFYVNVIPGAAVLALVWRFGDFDKGDASLSKGFDWFGLGAMAIFLMSMTYVLEEGASENWFTDDRIVILSVVAVVTGVAFIWRCLAYFNPIVELRTFRNTNFLVGSAFTFVMGMNLFGASFILPLFLGRVGGMSAGEIGTIMGVGGLSMFFAGPFIRRIVGFFDLRLVMVVGMAISAGGLWTAHALTPEWGFTEFAVLQIVRAFGLMSAMVASQQLSMATLEPQYIKNASGIVNLFRNVGGAVGLASIGTIINDGTLRHMADIRARMTETDPNGQAMLAGLVQRMSDMGVVDPEGAARKALTFMTEKQAMTIAFGEAFALLAVVTFITGFIALISQKPPQTAVSPASKAAAAAAAEAH
ncbi:MAG: DHA2 family efflux MFS transporter permease subunit [Alphaproteobacteria bacterium]|nr:DHA2 family efflux MFS transporter permease subunit [Alphaproteobacteria bacterium]